MDNSISEGIYTLCFCCVEFLDAVGKVSLHAGDVVDADPAAEIEITPTDLLFVELADTREVTLDDGGVEDRYPSVAVNVAGADAFNEGNVCVGELISGGLCGGGFLGRRRDGGGLLCSGSYGRGLLCSGSCGGGLGRNRLVLNLGAIIKRQPAEFSVDGRLAPVVAVRELGFGDIYFCAAIYGLHYAVAETRAGAHIKIGFYIDSVIADLIARGNVGSNDICGIDQIYVTLECPPAAAAGV